MRQVKHILNIFKNDGSLIVYPLKYARNKVFGTIGIDTLQESEKNFAFTENEISFYQVCNQKI